MHIIYTASLWQHQNIKLKNQPNLVIGIFLPIPTEFSKVLFFIKQFAPMKYHEKPIDFKISHFQLKLIPTIISFHNPQAPSYALQVCKGPQIYKKFNEVIQIQEAQTNYRFIQGQSAIFKLQSQRNMSCDWSLYKIMEDDFRDFVGSVTVDLSQAYSSYLQNIKRYSKEYSKLLSSQQLGQPIAHEWLKIKEQITNQFEIQATNQELKVDLRGKFVIKSEIDHLVEDEINKIQERKLAKTMSKNSVSVHSKQSLAEQPLSFTFHAAQQPQPRNNCQSSEPPSQKMDYIEIVKLGVVGREALSDIVEVSVSNQESNLNLGEKASKKPSGLSQAINEIPEEECESSPIRTGTRTQNYDNLGIGEDIDNLIKNRSRSRSNTSEQNHQYQNELKPSICIQNNRQQRELVSAEEYPASNEGESFLPEKSQLQQGLETAPQSLIKPEQPQSSQPSLQAKVQQPILIQQPAKTGSRIKIVLAVLVLVILLFGSFYSLANLDQSKIGRGVAKRGIKKQNQIKEQQKPTKDSKLQSSQKGEQEPQKTKTKTVQPTKEAQSKQKTKK